MIQHILENYFLKMESHGILYLEKKYLDQKRSQTTT